MAPSATAGHTKRERMSQERRTAPPARSAARTARNPATEVPPQDTASRYWTTTSRKASWWEAAVAAVELLATSGDIFTVDSIRETGVSEPLQPQMWATLVRTMQQRGVIRCIGTTLSLRADGTFAPARLWRGAQRPRIAGGGL